MHWAAEQGHLSTLKLLGEHFDMWTDADKVCCRHYSPSAPRGKCHSPAIVSEQFGRNALHCAGLGGHKDCAFWLIRNAEDASQFMSLTLVRRS
jgi:hypothetical protein